MTLFLTREEQREIHNCFSHIKNNKDISLSEVKNLIDPIWESLTDLKISGILSIQSSEFKQIFDYILYKVYISEVKPNICLETDLIISEDLLNFICRYIGIVEFKLQITLPVMKDTWEKNLFYHNLQILYEIFPTRNLFFNLNIDKAIIPSKELKSLFKEFPKIKSIQITPLLYKKEKGYEPWSHKHLINPIYTYAKIAWKYKKDTIINCSIYPCMFYPWQYSKLITFSKSSTSCKEESLNILGDTTISVCPILKNKCSNKINNWLSIETFYLDCVNKSREDMKCQLSRCNNCKYFKMQLCNGPCHGCRGLNNI